MIVDLHCHAAGLGFGGSGCFVSPALRHGARFPWYLRAFGVTLEELREEGDALVLRRLSERLSASSEVRAAVVLALDAVVGRDGTVDRERTESFVPDAFVAAETARSPNLLFGASVHPHRPDALERLDRARALGAVLVKWLPPVQEIDPADRRFVPFYERLAELGLPLLTHTGWERSFGRSRDALGDPSRLRLPLEVGVTVVAAHAGASGRSAGQPNFERFRALAERYPNLYADLSSLTQANHPGALARLLAETRLHGRLLYGTDMPLAATALVSPWLHARRLGLAGARRIARIPNPWDRDVALKRALGVPEAVFARTATFLGVAPPPEEVPASPEERASGSQANGAQHVLDGVAGRRLRGVRGGGAGRGEGCRS